MKLISAIIIILLASGCTSLKPIEMSREQLHERIATGDIIKVGDDVRIFTDDGDDHEFKVTAISDDQISGSDEAVPIADVIALETREFSDEKTAALTAGSLVLGMVIATVAVAGFSL